MDTDANLIVGDSGTMSVQRNDDAIRKLMMLIEGECCGLGPSKASKKYGYSRQRYHQLMNRFKQGGLESISKKKTGPRRKYRCTEELTRQVIRYRFLDHNISAEVIAQKLRQNHFRISVSSVEKIITEYGLQKKTPHQPSGKALRKN